MIYKACALEQREHRDQGEMRSDVGGQIGRCEWREIRSARVTNDRDVVQLPERHVTSGDAGHVAPNTGRRAMTITKIVAHVEANDIYSARLQALPDLLINVCPAAVARKNYHDCGGRGMGSAQLHDRQIANVGG